MKILKLTAADSLGLAPERVPFDSVEVVRVQSHWVPWDRVPKKGSTYAACGAYVGHYELSTTPTCPECHRQATMTAEEMFGAEEMV